MSNLPTWAAERGTPRPSWGSHTSQHASYCISHSLKPLFTPSHFHKHTQKPMIAHKQCPFNASQNPYHRQKGSLLCPSEVQHYARGQCRNVSCHRSARVGSLFVKRTPSVTCCLECPLHRVSCGVGELTPTEPGMARWAFWPKQAALFTLIVTESASARVSTGWVIMSSPGLNADCL